MTNQTLIPRQETEYLVDLLSNGESFKKGVDVGVGSGVILLTLMKRGKIQEGLGIDISSKALEVAQENAHKLNLEASFLLNDRLTGVETKFDLIVSNPPYIKQNSHRKFVHDKVDEFEPSISLYLDDEIYDTWFAEFFQQVRERLNSKGLFAMEGHEFELLKQQEILSGLGFINVKVIKDLAGSDRFLFANLK